LEFILWKNTGWERSAVENFINKMKKQNKSPLITVVICTYNTKEITLRCLDKLKIGIDHLTQPVETIVVENGTDGTGKILKDKYAWVKVLEPKENTGFARGNNFGIKKSDKRSQYFLFLNSDALVKKETLLRSVEFMEKNVDCDAHGCKLVLANGKMQPSAGYLPSPFSVFTWIWGMDLIPFLNKNLKQVHPKDREFFRNVKKVGWVMGAYLFIKRNVVEKTGGFDENFFMYMEEVEWCKRIADSGYDIYYTPGFSVTHLDKASSRKYPEKMRKVYVNEILGIIYYLKRYHKNSLIWLLPLIKIGVAARIFAFAITGNELRKDAYKEALNKL
jgi:GT2 family glycosyltransferase